ncbi:tRNA methyltransferase 10 homolog B-like [Dysidea avara]|uniref:tRNA methyltransferase 10 homolog B-like n=1 Tax=Dysidea avara TaxID=196820 RepID=UPI0033239F9B
MASANISTTNSTASVNEDDFITVKGVKVPQVRGGKRWEEQSKNAQKKIIALYRKKALRKHHKLLQRQAALESETPVESEKSRTQVSSDTVKTRTSPIKDKFPEKIKLVIDCGFVHMMTPKEVCKLACQICYSYGMNNKMGRPFELHLTRVANDGAVVQECQRQIDGFDSVPISKTEKQPTDIFDCSKLVYLTPDAKDDLLTLEKDNVYIVGGLVDENVIKRASLNYARTKKISTARLPISTYMVNPSAPRSSARAVLTIDQVIHLLAMIYCGSEWPQALQECIPKRKGLIVKDKYQ